MAKTTVAFIKSDHALLEAKVVFGKAIRKGPGCFRINPTLIANEHYSKKVEKVIKEAIDECPTTFNPHMRWDFIKMQIRTVYMEISSEDRKNTMS